MIHPPRSNRAPRAARAAAAAAVALLACAAPARAQLEFIETDQMRLVYHAPTQGFLAPYVARCFERSMRFYRGRFAWTPSEPVTVTLADVADYGNAAVWVTPRNSMLVHLAPTNFVYETGPSNERINFTMNHEVAHVLTLDQAAGTDRLFRALFLGKVREIPEHPESMLYAWLTVPRRASTRWYREGMAVFFETWMAGGLGRAQGPWDEMVFRAMVRDSAPFWDPLGLESEGVKTDFQAGVNSYLYGTRFLSYMVWRDGPDKLLRWLDRGPGSRAYFASQFAAVYGRSLDDAWRAWIAWERDFQRANLDTLARWPETPTRDLSPRALGSVSRAFVDTASRSIIAAVYSPGSLAHLAALPLDGGAPRPLAEVKGAALYFVSSVAFDPEGRRVFFTTDNDEWRDLRVLELATGRTRLLQRDVRIGDLAFDRSDRSLWGVRHFNGMSTVVRIPEPWTDWRRVVSFPYGRDLYDLDISPDGSLIAASVAEISGRQTLRVFRREGLLAGDTTSRTLHDFGVSIPQTFVFTPDGRRLVGSSYYTGVSNLWRYDLDAGTMDIVSNTTTGLFRPLPLGGDSLVAFRYTGRGFVPVALEARPLSDVAGITFLGAQLVARYPELAGWKVPPPSAIDLDSLVVRRGTYRPLASVRPATLYPIVQAYKDRASFGVRLDASDPMARHAMDLAVTWTPDDGLPDDQRWHLSAGWTHGPWDARLRWNPASFYDLVGPTKSSRKGVNAGLGWGRELLRDRPRTLELGARLDGWTGLERLPDYQNVETSPGFDKLLAGFADLRYRNLRSSIGAIDTEKGVAWALETGVNGVRFVRRDDAAWRGFAWTAGTFEAGTPLPVRNASLWLRSAAGWSPGDPDEPFANFFFGGFGNNVLDHQDPKRYRRYESFPGTELNAVGGTNFGRALLDLNLPPLRFSRLGRMTLFASWARLSVFGGGLVTNVDRPAHRRELGTAGAQADLRVQVLLGQPLTLSGGYARAFERGERFTDEWMVSLKIL
uniref:Bacterial surface antigen (D15) domain-containing protein n=1 Tax=Eiseniibacteriota bacterium TaxID=2212470 RepID=A0A832HZR5_UNCEI